MRLLERGEELGRKYNEEDDMRRNIQDGITTLEELGFKRSQPTEAEV